MIIRSLLDTDLYKFTMMQVVLHHFPSAQVEYRFKCRSAGINLAQYADEIMAEIRALDQLRFAPDELEYLRALRFIKPDFVDFLGLFHFNHQFIKLTPNHQSGEIDLHISGPWLHTILYEVPVLAIINEVYFRHQDPTIANFQFGEARLLAKLDKLSEPDLPKSFTFTDFGTRRRYSKDWHRHVLRTCQARAGKRFIGTSNVMLAKELDLLAVGTMAHEYLQACQALGPRLRDSQKYALQVWANEYRGDLGIALSDVTGMKAFIRDYDLYFCKLFDGARHDSGDPYAWGEQLLAHYHNMRIDPLNKSMIFSDGLTMDSAIALCRYFEGRTKLGFGIGTHLTNDLGATPLQIVIKMIRCNGQPVAKVSDAPGKTMCEDENYLAYLKQVFDIT